ncbi:uncharacterized protein RAG0_00890 [Rhynchosporium agropyri]|uniref:Uncharacterized protein n=1 Tax=Rhynchosporium agropyri TaxID=914238 RepID=A0A1E1JV27_9HELO|nr:uncharacterized protein RAG0_00890 [Rhynchosporium agropyri]
MNEGTVKREIAKVKGENPERLNLGSVPDVTMDRAGRMTLQAFVPAKTSTIAAQPTRSLSTAARDTFTFSKDTPAFNQAQNLQLGAPVPSSFIIPSSPYVANVLEQPPHMDKDDLYTSSPAKLNSYASRNNLKRVVEYNESEDDDEGGPIRDGQQRGKRQKRKGDISQEGSHIRIGHHSAEPLVSVFSKFKKSATGNRIPYIYSRPISELFPSGKQWNDYVSTNNIVGMENVTLDDFLFPASKASAEFLSNDKKRDMVKQYLSSLVDQDSAQATPASQSKPKFNQVPAFIVGYHFDDLELPVRAHLCLKAENRGAALLFRIDKEDIEKSNIEFNGIRVLPNKIKFLPEFKKPTEKETKAEVMTRFLANENEEVAATEDPPSPSQKKCGRRRLTDRSGTPVNAPRLNIELRKGIAGGVDAGLELLQASGQTYLTAAFEYGQKLRAREDTALLKEVSLMEREAVVQDRERFIDEEITARVAAALSAERQITNVSGSEQSAAQKRIEDPERQLEQARNIPSSTSTQVSASNSGNRSSASKSLFLDLNGANFHEAYTKIPEQSLNAGWYVKSQAQIKTFDEGPLEGKKFSQNQILQPIQGIAVPGRLKETAVRYGDVEYLHYEEGGVSKLVQSSQSVTNHEGKEDRKEAPLLPFSASFDDGNKLQDDLRNAKCDIHR